MKRIPLVLFFMRNPGAKTFITLYTKNNHEWVEVFPEYLPYSPVERSREVNRPLRRISLVLFSDRESQKRTRLSKCPLIIFVLCIVIKSLQLDPANIVFVPAEINKKNTWQKLYKLHEIYIAMSNHKHWYLNFEN